MKCLYQILLPLLGLFFYRVELTDYFPLRIRVTDYHVLDGDTVSVKILGRVESIRLIPIDAPEKGQPFLRSKGDAGAYSKDCLKELLGQRELTLIWGGRDLYGRVLGSLETEGVNISERMIQRGCAVLYLYSRFSSKNEKRKWLGIQRRAQREKAGVWSRGIMSPYHYRKIKKKTSKRI